MFFLALLGCSKTEQLNPVTNADKTKQNTARVEEKKPFLLRYENLHPQVKESFVYYDAENEFLHFSDYLIFDKVRTELMNKDKETLVKWESQFEGFTSLKSIYDKAIEAQVKEVTSLSLQAAAEIAKNNDKKVFYAPLVNANKDKFIFEENGSFKMDIAFDEIASLVNGEGILRISGDIYLYKKNAIRILKKGDITQIPNLKKANKSDDKDIVVLPITASVSNISNGRTESTCGQLQNNYTLNVSISWCSGNFRSWIDRVNYSTPIYDYTNVIGTQCFLGICGPMYALIGYTNSTRLTAGCDTKAKWLCLIECLYSQWRQTITGSLNVNGSPISINRVNGDGGVSSTSFVIYDSAPANFSGSFINFTTIGTSIGTPILINYDCVP